MQRKRALVVFLCTIIAAQPVAVRQTAAEDRLLNEAVNFTGTLTWLATRAPGFILVAVRNGETAVAGFGTIGDKDGKAPDANTIFRIGSISKVFCGEVLASLALDGKLRFEDRLQDRLGYDVKLPEKDGRAIRLINLVTHSSGLPREVPREDGPPSDPFANNTKQTQIASLKSDPLLFAPGNAALYSAAGLRALFACLSPDGVALLWSGFTSEVFESRVREAGFAVACEPFNRGRREISHFIYVLSKRQAAQ